MNIKKGNKVYIVREYAKSWSVLRQVGDLTLTFNVPKTLCESFDELCE